MATDKKKTNAPEPKNLENSDVVVTKNYNIPTEVKEKFEVINWTGGHTQVFGRFGKINLEKLTVAKATQLVDNGFSKLVKK